jgi:hypothetical protein
MLVHFPFPIGKYTLDSPVSTFSGLHEFSFDEYSTMGRTFEDGKNFNAPPEMFLDRHWKVMLGTVGGKVYKIAAYLEFHSKTEANPVAMQALNYCTEQLGKPTEEQTGLFVWDTTNGNVILQTGETAEGLAINLFETSSSVRQFKRR